MKMWKYFIGACIIAGGALIKVGAPVVAVVAGIAIAAFITWKRQASRA